MILFPGKLGHSPQTFACLYLTNVACHLCTKRLEKTDQLKRMKYN